MTKPFMFLLGFILAAGIGMAIAGVEVSHKTKMSDNEGGQGKSCQCHDMTVSKSSMSVEWIGAFVANNNDKHWPSTFWMPSVEVGLREDGAVVWRKSESK